MNLKDGIKTLIIEMLTDMMTLIPGDIATQYYNGDCLGKFSVTAH